MSEFMTLDADAPATLEAVVEAVTRLSRYPEAQVLEMVTAGRLRDFFPFTPASQAPIPADYADEHDLPEAIPVPLTREQQQALIRASMPSAAGAVSTWDTSTTAVATHKVRSASE